MRFRIYLRVSTDYQRIRVIPFRMIKEYLEKKDYVIIDVYNDDGHSRKDLMRQEMQRLTYIKISE